MRLRNMSCDASQGIYVPLQKSSTAVLALLKILSALFGSTVSNEPSQTASLSSSDRSPHPVEPCQADDKADQVNSVLSGDIPSAEPAKEHSGRYVLMLRLAALVIALTPLTLLGVARYLKPSSEGLGTHHQLGLPPCSMRVLLGIRCPGCGMTTSWAHFTRGQWGQSIRVNPGGFLLAIFGLVTAVLAFGVVRLGHVPSQRIQLYYTFGLVGIAIITLLDWCSRLMA